MSAHRRSPSFISGGGGRKFSDLAPDFPLLIKRICAEKRLSVQVHPNDLTARTVGGEAKTEMWCVLEGGPIFAGFQAGTTADDVRRAVKDGSFESLLVRFDAQPGECYFIPGGLVHAIGEGTSVYEVQQSSDTTFRLYDWGRVDDQGRPRKLHVEEALWAMDLSLPPPVPAKSVTCPYFDFSVRPAGDEGCAPNWRVVFEPTARDTFAVEPGERLMLESPSFVTSVRAR